MVGSLGTESAALRLHAGNMTANVGGERAFRLSFGKGLRPKCLPCGLGACSGWLSACLPAYLTALPASAGSLCMPSCYQLLID